MTRNDPQLDPIYSRLDKYKSFLLLKIFIPTFFDAISINEDNSWGKSHGNFLLPYLFAESKPS